MRVPHPVSILSAFLLTVCLLLCLPVAHAQNHVLSLDGAGDYVRVGNQSELAPDNFTIEGWVKPASQVGMHLVSRFDNDVASYEIYLLNDSVKFHMRGPDQQMTGININIPQFGTWLHMAMTFGGDYLTAYFNGTRIARVPVKGGLSKPDIPFLIGASRDGSMFSLHGLIDEVRIWSHARSESEIRAALSSRLTGNESGLVAYWDFEGEGKVVPDRTGHGHDGMLKGDTRRIAHNLPTDIPACSILSGMVHSSEGQAIPGVSIQLKQGARNIVQTKSGGDGHYRLAWFPTGKCDLYATQGVKASLVEDLSIQPGEWHTQDLLLRNSVSVEGKVLYPDGTPSAGVVVQAVLTSPDKFQVVMASTLTDKEGVYQFIRLKPGAYHVRCHIGGENQYHETTPGIPETITVESGRCISRIDFHVPAFRKGVWRSYTHLDGLPDNSVRAIYKHSDGTMWVGTDGGVASYQAGGFTSLTVEGVSAHNIVRDIEEDADGRLWFSTPKGLLHYDGTHLQSFTTQDGLIDNDLGDICRDNNDRLWCASGASRSYYGGVSYYDGQHFTSLGVRDGLAANRARSLYQSSDGAIWIGTLGGGVSRYDGEHFTNLSILDGLAGDFVYSISEDRDSQLWFGTNAGVSRYSDGEFTNLTTQDGLPSNDIWSILPASDGSIWFGTSNGLSQYNGKCFTNYTPETGLGAKYVFSIFEEAEGILWFGTNRGVVRYDAGSLVTWTARDGLPSSNVRAVHRDRSGALWFGTDKGLHRYENEIQTTFTQQDGLSHDSIYTIYEDSSNRLWFGAALGVSRYEDGQFIKPDFSPNIFRSFYQSSDGTIWAAGPGIGRIVEDKRWVALDYTILRGWASQVYEDRDGIIWATTNRGVHRYDGTHASSLTTLDGLAGDDATTLLQLPDGTFWFGTNSGVSHYDGTEFINYRYSDGLASNWVSSSCLLSNGNLCFGTYSGGVALYDGTTWSSLDSRDGLPSDQVFSVSEDTLTGALWVCTDEGAVEYQFSSDLPVAVIETLSTSRGTFDELEIPASTTGRRVTIGYSAIDYKTYPDKRQYRWRIQELDSNWRKPTKSDTANVVPERPGTYTFEVQAIDRDLNYSEPASVTLTVVNPFYLRAAFLVPTVGGGSILVVVSIVLAVGYIRRRRQVHAYERYAAQELQNARQMQMSLMPEHAPIIDGAEIAGRCVTANTVGGDFFAYLAGTGLSQVGLVVADVSGKAMRGAMNAVLADGILSSVADEADTLSPATLMTKVNSTLTARMESDMNVTMVIALLDTQTMTLTLANAAHHAYPLLVRDGKATELRARGLPLGMRAGVEYREETFDLQSDDILVLLTDGIIEAHDADGRMYGDSGRLEQILTGFTEHITAEAMVDAVIQDATDYANGNREDDATVLIAKIGEK